MMLLLLLLQSQPQVQPVLTERSESLPGLTLSTRRTMRKQVRVTRREQGLESATWLSAQAWQTNSPAPWSGEARAGSLDGIWPNSMHGQMSPTACLLSWSGCGYGSRPSFLQPPGPGGGGPSEHR